MAALIHQALLERARHGRRVPRPAAVTLAVTALLGLLDEGIQLVLPSRVFDWNDVFFNAFAGFMVIVARLALAPVLRRQVPRAGWWLLASTIGWVLAIPLGDLNGPPGWAIFGAVSGAMLVWLLRQKRHAFDQQA